jgi:hypothetical protein
MQDPTKFANELRKAAAYIRSQDEVTEKAKTEKIAKILVAARGLAELKRILSSETTGR